MNSLLCLSARNCSYVKANHKSFIFRYISSYLLYNRHTHLQDTTMISTFTDATRNLAKRTHLKPPHNYRKSLASYLAAKRNSPPRRQSCWAHTVMGQHTLDLVGTSIMRVLIYTPTVCPMTWDRWSHCHTLNP